MIRALLHYNVQYTAVNLVFTVLFSFRKWAAFSSAEPPISPIRTIPFSKRVRGRSEN